MLKPLLITLTLFTLIAIGAAPSQAKSPKLQADLQELDSMIGTWDCIETFHAGGFTPTKVVARGVDKIRTGPSGASLIADYNSNSSMGPYSGHGVLYFDASDETFHFHWFDTFSPLPQIAKGKLSNGKLVLEHEANLGQGPVTMRRTYSNMTRTSTRLVLEMIDGAGNVTKLMTMTKKRRHP